MIEDRSELKVPKLPVHGYLTNDYINMFKTRKLKDQPCYTSLKNFLNKKPNHLILKMGKGIK